MKKYMLIEYTEEKETKLKKDGKLQISGYPKVIAVYPVNIRTVLKLLKIALFGKIPGYKTADKSNIPTEVVMTVDASASGAELLNELTIYKDDKIKIKKR